MSFGNPVCSVSSPNGGTTAGSGATVTIGLKEGEDVTCTFINARKAHFVKLIKSLVPPSDSGLFDLTAAGSTAGGQGNGGFVQNANVVVGASVSVSEIANAGSGANLANYTSSLKDCTGISATGTTSASFTMPDNDVACTVTNTRKAHTLTLTKTVLPAGDTGTFSLTAGTHTNGAAGNNGSVSDQVTSGTSTGVSEVANANYTAGTISCNAGVTTPASFTMPDADVSCTVTNTRKAHTLTLTKTVLPAGDTGTFSLTAGTHTNGAAGNNGSVSDQVTSGTSTGVSEVANANYTAGTISCNAGVTTPASFTMPDADVSCTVTNTRKKHTLTLTKTVLPAGDPGTFSLTAGTQNNPTAGNNQSVSDQVTGGASTGVSEVANANYTAGTIPSCNAGGNHPGELHDAGRGRELHGDQHAQEAHPDPDQDGVAGRGSRDVQPHRGDAEQPDRREQPIGVRPGDWRGLDGRERSRERQLHGRSDQLQRGCNHPGELHDAGCGRELHGDQHAEGAQSNADQGAGAEH